jgi:hypothetical protein
MANITTTTGVSHSQRMDIQWHTIRMYFNVWDGRCPFKPAFKCGTTWNYSVAYQVLALPGSPLGLIVCFHGLLSHLGIVNVFLAVLHVLFWLEEELKGPAEEVKV